jgi:allantoinase
VLISRSQPRARQQRGGEVAEGFDCLYEEGATHPQMLSVGLHMRHIERPGRIGALQEFIWHARGVPRAWFARRLDIARG